MLHQQILGFSMTLSTNYIKAQHDTYKCLYWA